MKNRCRQCGHNVTRFGVLRCGVLPPHKRVTFKGYG